MVSEFKMEDIHDKEINFLFGSGASNGLFPTLKIGIKNNGKDTTIETLATQIFENDDSKKTLLFMHYYLECIEPILDFSLTAKSNSIEGKEVLKNYVRFLKKTLSLLKNKKTRKRCNIFTTNYDSCFYTAADEIFKEGRENFFLNDGVRGFREKVLLTKNFNSHLVQSGIFEKFSDEIPQINLMHLHGSIFWKADGDKILVDYTPNSMKINFTKAVLDKIKKFSMFINDSTKDVKDIPKINLTKDEIAWFWSKYNLLPIVNPTKKKFSQTLFDEHYYHMLRNLSYELEKENSIFIIFGFSFDDEHIESIVKRSLTNPKLQIYLHCFNENDYQKFKTKFKNFNNICYLRHKKNLNFTFFNNEIYCLEEEKGKNIDLDLDDIWGGLL